MSQPPQTPQVYGVQETMRALREIEPKLRTEAIKTIKMAAEPLRAEVAGSLPTSAPLSGMDYSGRLGWGARGSAKVMTKYGGRRSRDRDVWPLVRIVLTGAAASIWDIAGRGSSGHTASGQAMISALNSRGGSASRTVWPTVEARLAAVQVAVLKAVRDVSAQVNKDLTERGGL